PRRATTQPPRPFQVPSRSRLDVGAVGLVDAGDESVVPGPALRHLTGRNLLTLDLVPPDDGVGHLAGPDELQPLTRLLLDVGRVAPALLLGLELGETLLPLRDLPLQRSDLTALGEVRPHRRRQ